VPEEVGRSGFLKELPVVILSSSLRAADRERALDAQESVFLIA
jgi:hypothetical protein